jgi:hypothetical protein
MAHRGTTSGSTAIRSRAKIHCGVEGYDPWSVEMVQYRTSNAETSTMATHVEATFSNGVLTPDRPFAEQTRVRLEITPVEESTREKALAALKAIEERLQKRPVHGGGVRYTRDELHERR